jgi:hypothetical protein
MRVIHSNLFFIVKRFPEHKEIIKRLYSESENFQEMCNDYQECDRALRHWSQSHSEDSPERRNEYAALMQDLEAEILLTLKEAE